MKKVVLSLGLLLAMAAPSFAQGSKGKQTKEALKASNTASVSPAAPSAATTDVAQNPNAIKFENEVHDFGTIPEGPTVEHEFVFKNTGKEPIIIQKAQPSCGCTTPSYSKDPILPGKSGSIKAAYATQGRPNAFTKTITIQTNLGTKILTIKGNVEKAPESSVPANNSMIKTN
ncbi:MAG TPA: DUF1573 domain-containing protein [Flavipsychrobacter sp.]|nr:DUF1573 domain-containing protein [Flavipsychrobacter sp.]